MFPQNTKRVESPVSQASRLKDARVRWISPRARVEVSLCITIQAPSMSPSPRHEAACVGALAPYWLLQGLLLRVPSNSPSRSRPGKPPNPDPPSSHIPQHLLKAVKCL